MRLSYYILLLAVVLEASLMVQWAEAATTTDGNKSSIKTKTVKGPRKIKRTIRVHESQPAPQTPINPIDVSNGGVNNNVDVKPDISISMPQESTSGVQQPETQKKEEAPLEQLPENLKSNNKKPADDNEQQVAPKEEPKEPEQMQIVPYKPIVMAPPAQEPPMQVVPYKPNPIPVYTVEEPEELEVVPGEEVVKNEQVANSELSVSDNVGNTNNNLTSNSGNIVEQMQTDSNNNKKVALRNVGNTETLIIDGVGNNKTTAITNSGNTELDQSENHHCTHNKTNEMPQHHQHHHHHHRHHHEPREPYYEKPDAVVSSAASGENAGSNIESPLVQININGQSTLGRDVERVPMVGAFVVPIIEDSSLIRANNLTAIELLKLRRLKQNLIGQVSAQYALVQQSTDGALSATPITLSPNPNLNLIPQPQLYPQIQPYPYLYPSLHPPPYPSPYPYLNPQYTLNPIPNPHQQQGAGPQAALLNAYMELAQQMVRQQQQPSPIWSSPMQSPPPMWPTLAEEKREQKKPKAMKKAKKWRPKTDQAAEEVADMTEPNKRLPLDKVPDLELDDLELIRELKAKRAKSLKND